MTKILSAIESNCSEENLCIFAKIKERISHMTTEHKMTYMLEIPKAINRQTEYENLPLKECTTEEKIIYLNKLESEISRKFTQRHKIYLYYSCLVTDASISEVYLKNKMIYCLEQYTYIDSDFKNIKNLIQYRFV